MKSPKQRRREIKAARRRRVERADQALREPEVAPMSTSAPVPVKREALAPYNSYGDPLFVTRGCYEDRPFRCRDCGKEQVWTAAQQQWWYETMKG